MSGGVCRNILFVQQPPVIKACGVALMWFHACFVQFWHFKDFCSTIIRTSHANAQFLIHWVTIPTLMTPGLRIVAAVHGMTFCHNFYKFCQSKQCTLHCCVWGACIGRFLNAPHSRWVRWTPLAISRRMSYIIWLWLYSNIDSRNWLARMGGALRVTVRITVCILCYFVCHLWWYRFCNVPCWAVN